MAKKDKPRPRRPNATGRSDKAGRFVALPFRVLESAAYASLDLKSRGVLQELVMLYNGGNNGSLYLSVRDAAARIGLSDLHAVQDAFTALLDRGFITVAKPAHFAIKAADSSRARCWRITWQAWPECPQRSKRAPTNEWEKYQVEGGTRASKRSDRRLRAIAQYRKDAGAGRLPVVDTTTTEAIMTQNHIEPVVDTTTAKSKTGAIPPFVVVVETTAHIDTTMGRGGLGWWATDQEVQIAGQILHLSIMAQSPPPLARAA
jgi:hypothetical protein